MEFNPNDRFGIQQSLQHSDFTHEMEGAAVNFCLPTPKLKGVPGTIVRIVEMGTGWVTTGAWGGLTPFEKK